MNDCKNKLKRLGKLSRNITLVTKGVLAVYPSIPYEDSLETLKERFAKSEDPQLPVKMAELVLKNNILEFNGYIKQQLVVTAIGTEFSPIYACIYMDKVETEFLKTQELQPLI